MEFFETKIKSRVRSSHLFFLRASISLGNYAERKKGMDEKGQRKKVDLVAMSRKQLGVAAGTWT